MFETITDADERGQVGIGTLIIFIAMILVAAVAAGVLINTAGELQSQASNTGSDTQQAVANQIEVAHATGEVATENGHINTLNLTVKKSAGSEEIDLTSATIQYTSSTTDQTLTYGGVTENYSDTFQQVANFTATNDGESFDPETAPLGYGNAEASNFTVMQTAGTSNVHDPSSLIHSDERVMLTIDLLAIEGEHGVSAGDSVDITLVDQSGAEYIYGVSVPNTFGDREVVKV